MFNILNIDISHLFVSYILIFNIINNKQKINKSQRIRNDCWAREKIQKKHKGIRKTR
jgi:hypothetical protein